MSIKKIGPIIVLFIGLIFLLLINYFFYGYFIGDKEISPEAQLHVDKEAIYDFGVQNEELVYDFHIGNSDFVMSDKQYGLEIIVFDDPSGPFAPEYYQTLKMIDNEYDEAKIALRLLPLASHDYSRQASLAVLCAGEQGKFFEAYEAVLDLNIQKQVNIDSIKSKTSVLVDDLESYNNCLVSSTSIAALEKWEEQADDNAVIGTPSTFIANTPYPGAYQLDDFVDTAGLEREGLYTIINEKLRMKNVE